MGAVLRIDIISDASKARKGFDETATAAERMDQKMAKGSRIAAGALAGLGAAAYKAVKAGEEVATVNARVGQTLSNMGMEKATDRVLKNAEAMSRKTGVDHKAIKEGQALLATFSEVAASADKQGGAFDRATQAAVDMAATGYGTVESNAVQLGKALQDPIKGISALTRSGVTFTEEQKKMIASMVETGDVAGAQNIILAEVEKQVGGVAEATANGTDKMSNAWAQVTESIGMALLPVLDRVLPLLLSIAEWAANNSGKIVAIGGAIAGMATAWLAVHGAIKLYLAVTKTVAAVTQAAATAQTVLRIAMMGSAGGIRAAATAMRAFTLTLLTNPVFLIITALVALVAVFVNLYKNNEKFRDAVDAAWEWMKGAATSVVEWIKGAWDWLVQAFKKIMDLYLAPYKWVWDQMKKIAEALWPLLKQGWESFIQFFQNIGERISAAWRRVIDGMKAVVRGAMDYIRSQMERLRSIVDRVRDTVSRVSDAFRRVKDTVVGAVRTMIDWVNRLIARIREIKLPRPSFSFGFGGFSSGSGYTAPTGFSAGEPTARVSTNAPAGPTVIVNGALDPVAVAEQIRRLLMNQDVRSGRAVSRFATVA